MAVVGSQCAVLGSGLVLLVVFFDLAVYFLFEFAVRHVSRRQPVAGRVHRSGQLAPADERNHRITCCGDTKKQDL
eukprot:scaffold13751_cov67-Skeletonema_dohrnii-CCMP3373.AAC.1